MTTLHQKLKTNIEDVTTNFKSRNVVVVYILVYIRRSITSTFSGLIICLSGPKIRTEVCRTDVVEFVQ